MMHGPLNLRFTFYGVYNIAVEGRQADTEARSLNRCCSGKATDITYSECVCLVLDIAVSQSVACPALPCFSTLSHKFSRKTVIEPKICVLIFSMTFV